MRVLVTRAMEDSQRTAQELARRGHEALVAPLSEVRLLDNTELNLDDIQAVLATSSNGIRAFAHRSPRREFPVFAIGANTAETARCAGFAQTSSAEGDSSALAAIVRKSVNPAVGALLLITGTRGTNFLHQELAKAGFKYRVWKAYDIVAFGALPERAARAFREGSLDAVLVLSPESARDLVQALKTAEIDAMCGRLLACCISGATAAAIDAIGFGAVRIAEKPNLQAVLDLLDSEPVRRR